MTEFRTVTHRVTITALMPDFDLGKLTLGQVREFVALLSHLPDDQRVAYNGSMARPPWGRPVSGGVLEVSEAAAPVES